MPAGTGLAPRRGTAGAWTSVNPVLLTGEMGVEVDTGAVKFGDGVTAWTALAYAGHVLPGGVVRLNNATANRVEWGTGGLGTPTLTALPSAGTKLLLYPLGADGASTDFAVGLASNELWFSVATSAAQWRWYAGATAVATLTGAGALSVATVTTTGFVQSSTTITAASFREGVVARTAGGAIASNTAALILCDATSAAQTHPLYNANGSPGQRFTITKTDAGTNAVTISVSGTGGTIAGAATVVLASQFDTAVVESTNTAGVWVLVALRLRNQAVAGTFAAAGASKLGGYRSVTANFTVSATTDKYIETTTAALTGTLPTAAAANGEDFYLINASTGSLTVNANGTEKIGNTSSATSSLSVGAGSTAHVVSNGTAWRIV